MPILTRSIYTLIGSFRIYIVCFKKKREDFESAIVLTIALLEKKTLYRKYSLKHCFKHASRIERYNSVDHCDDILRSVNHALIERK